ncbi:hypothetical protein BURK_005337 [Burkholderia sp. SJ98]|nr:hypothetical protein BURK_005337 [Burkholderia sp. SJ98]
MGSVFSYIILAAVIGVPYYHIRRKQKLKAKSYKWYRATYPEAMKGNRVACHSCGDDRVQVRNVMRKTFMREHFCGQCGENLYYSAEGKI